MTKQTLKIIPVLLITMFMAGQIALASETTGTLKTGIEANVGTGMNGVVISVPIANPAPATFSSAQNVSLTADGASSIRYTKDGTDPVCPVLIFFGNGTTYSNPISIESTVTLKAISCYAEDKKSSVASYAYSIVIPTPISTNNPPAGGGSGSGGGGGGSPTVNTNNTNTTNVKFDINNDGKVNILEFVALMSNWGKTGTGNIADFNNDSRVDILDFVLLMANWTK